MWFFSWDLALLQPGVTRRISNLYLQKRGHPHEAVRASPTRPRVPYLGRGTRQQGSPGAFPGAWSTYLILSHYS